MMIKTGLSLIGLAILAGCTTAAPDRTLPATLADASDNKVRNLIRTFVADTVGGDYIVDPDMLTTSDTLIARNRGRGEAMGRPELVPDRTFKLVLVETRQGMVCQLRSDMDSDAVLTLPDGAGCDALAD